ncbi:MAG: hypothetical protein ACYSUF_00555 [Planctomycetota bacterium]|jgi:hypothetical protein
MRQNTITALLAVIAVLLGVNFVSGGSMQSAQVEPTVVAGAVSFPDVATGFDSERRSEVALMIRFWSDGAVDATRLFSEKASGRCGGEVPMVCDGPTPLILAPASRTSTATPRSR